MPYRLCTFDSSGKIVGVSKESFNDSNDAMFSFTSINPFAHSLIDESLIPTEVIEAPEAELEVGFDTIFDGTTVVAKPFDYRSAHYGPDTEVTLYLKNDYDQRYIRRGLNLIQDVTKVANVYNTIAPETKPVHSAVRYKFPPTSAKFTKSTSGYTGGYLYLTNLSKYDRSGGYTAPHNNIGVGLTYSWAVELFFYPTGTGSNFTLLQKGPSGTAANWKLGYDNSAGQLQFAWQSYGSTSGYNYTQNIVNTAGMTANTWHHVAVAMVRNGSGVCYQMSGYFNGTNRFSIGLSTASTTPEVRFNGGLYVGNNSAGNESFNGYIDSLRVLESPGTGGLFGPSGYGFLPFGGGTLGVPTASGFTRNSQTALIMNFNNLPDASRFYVESMDYISGVVTKALLTDLATEDLGATSGFTGPIVSVIEVGLKDIYRHTVGYTAGATGYSDPTGFTTNYGDVSIPYVNTTPLGSTATVVHGYDYSWQLNSVFDNAPTIDVYRRTYRNDLRYDFGLEMMTVIEGICGNRGSCGSIFAPQFGQNPFYRLFNGPSGGSGNCYGVGLAHNSLFLNPVDATTMRYIMDNGYLVTQGISQPTYQFVDAIGLTRTLTATDISNLRLDILEYHGKIVNGYNQVKAQMDTASTKNQIKFAKVKKSYNPTILGPEELFGPEDFGGIEGL